MPVAEQTPNVPFTNSVPVANAVRTGVQGITGSFIVEFIEAFNLYDFTDRQYGLAVVAFGMILSFVQNFFEKRRNQKFFGAAPEPRVKSPQEGGYATPDLVVAVLCFVVGVILTKLFWC